MSSTEENSDSESPAMRFYARGLVALAQGAGLAALLQAADAPRHWPATDPYAYGALGMVAIFAPIIPLLALGRLRWRGLVLWTLVAAAALAGLAIHAVWRIAPQITPAAQGMFVPGFEVWFVAAAALLIAHVLVVDWLAPDRSGAVYPAHFDTAWKIATQFALAMVFVGVFWGLLTLGAGLFKLLNIEFFVNLLQRRWFAIPATTLAQAVALHVTDVRPGLIRGARSLALTLFSWLLPLFVVILGGFLASLLFVSLEPLWKTRFAASLLTTAGALLIFLINATYQDGGAEALNSRVKRWACALGAIELAPVAALAIVALDLRVAEYGWTGQRVTAAALLAILACYALGYVAALFSPTFMKRLETTNIATAWITLAIIAALFSPVADPSRIGVASQIERLRSGTVAPEKFDFVSLKFDGARWGAAALADLRDNATGPDAGAIKSRASAALAMTSRYAGNAPNGQQKSAADKLTMIAVLPEGRSLPVAFVDLIVEAPASPLANCFLAPTNKCVARFVTVAPLQPEALLVFGEYVQPMLFESDAGGAWKLAGNIVSALNCRPLIDALRAAAPEFTTREALDILISGEAYALSAPPPACRAPAK